MQHIFEMVEGATASCRGKLHTADAELANGGATEATEASERACKTRCQLQPVDTTNLECVWTNTTVLWNALSEYGTIQGGFHTPDTRCHTVVGGLG